MVSTYNELFAAILKLVGRILYKTIASLPHNIGSKHTLYIFGSLISFYDPGKIRGDSSHRSNDNAASPCPMPPPYPLNDYCPLSLCQ